SAAAGSGRGVVRGSSVRETSGADATAAGSTGGATGSPDLGDAGVTAAGGAAGSPLRTVRARTARPPTTTAGKRIVIQEPGRCIDEPRESSLVPRSTGAASISSGTWPRRVRGAAPLHHRKKGSTGARIPGGGGFPDRGGD